jgi:hypothetical protein
LRLAERLTKAATKMALGSIPNPAEWGVEWRSLEEAVSRCLKPALTIPLAALLFSLLNPAFALLSLPLLYLSVKLSAAYAAHSVLGRKLIAEKYSPLIIDELRLAYRVTRSLERSVAFIAEGGYPEVSLKMRRLLKEAEGGEDLAEGLLRYAAAEAPPSLKDFIPRFLRDPLKCSMPSSLYAKMWELHLEDVKKLRLNSLILFSLGFLLPVPATLAALLAGRAFLLPLTVPLYTLALALAARLMSLKRLSPMG